MVFACPLNFNIKDDCCISTDVIVDNVDSNTIINSNEITTYHAQAVNTFIKTLYFENAHILTSQPTKPTAIVTQAGLPAPGITAAETSAQSTDIAGKIGITGTPGAGSIVTITYHTPYPSGSVPTVILTADTDIAAECIKTGVYVGSAYNLFSVAFKNALTPPAANPVFNYSITCTIPA